MFRRDDTPPWKGGYQPYDLVKEACIAVGVIALLAIVLSVVFSSPDDKPSTIAQWAHQKPVDFVTAAVKELDGTSPTAEYGPPYNHNGAGQAAWILKPQKWLGVSHPIDTEVDFVVGPLETIPNDPALAAALAQYRAAPANQKKAWASGSAGPVPAMMGGLLALAQSGGLDGALLAGNQFFQTDYTKPLLFMADGGLLGERAEEQHLLGEQWGMMNETGSYPGQAWLWLYALWYQVEPFKSSANADIWVMLMMSVLSLAFICIPLLPGIRSIPRKIPIYKLIWREHYRESSPRSSA